MKCQTEWSKHGIKIVGRNVNNLRHAYDITLMAESEEELKSLFIKVKENEKAGLKLNIQKMQIMESSPITSWQIDGETMETVTDSIILGFKITTELWITVKLCNLWFGFLISLTYRIFYPLRVLFFFFVFFFFFSVMWTQTSGLVQNWKRNMSKLYIVTLLI